MGPGARGLAAFGGKGELVITNTTPLLDDT